MRREKKIHLVLPDSIKGQQTAKEMKLNRKQIYWISQVTGWFVFIGVNLFIVSSFEELTWQRLLVWIFLGILGIVFNTHSSRNNQKKELAQSSSQKHNPENSCIEHNCRYNYLLSRFYCKLCCRNIQTG